MASESTCGALLLAVLSFLTQSDLYIKYQGLILLLFFMLRTQTSLPYENTAGCLHVGHWFDLVYVLQRIWAGLYPSRGPLINKGMCSLLSLSRSESLQRKLRRGPRGVSLGRELSKSCDVFWEEGGCDDSCGYLIKQMGFSSGEHWD